MKRKKVLALITVCLIGLSALCPGSPIDVATRISLNFDDTPIATVLKMVANDQSGRCHA